MARIANWRQRLSPRWHRICLNSIRCGAGKHEVARRPPASDRSPAYGSCFRRTTESTDARISASPRSGRHSRDGRGGAVRVSAAAADAGRSRRDPGRRQCNARAARAHPHLARIERAALHAILHLDRQAAAWRSRRVPDLQRAGAEDDRPARRAVDLDRAVDHHPLHRGRGAARRDRGVEARHLDRPLRDGTVGDRLLGPGVRDRLCADPDFCDRPALAAGAGLSRASPRASGRFSSASSCRPARCPSSMSR